MAFLSSRSSAARCSASISRRSWFCFSAATCNCVRVREDHIPQGVSFSRVAPRQAGRKEAHLLPERGQDALLEHARGKDLEHAPPFLDAFLLRERFFLLVVRTLVVLVFLLVVVVIVARVAAVLCARLVVVKRFGRFAIAPDALVGELLHHLEEFLPIVLQEFVGDSEDPFLDRQALAKAEKVAFARRTSRLFRRRRLIICGTERLVVVVLQAAPTQELVSRTRNSC